jgi:hypothetical protein
MTIPSFHIIITNVSDVNISDFVDILRISPTISSLIILRKMSIIVDPNSCLLIN